METERNIGINTVSFARVLGILETSFPEFVGTYISKRGIENGISDLHKIESIENRGSKALLVGNVSDTNIPENLPNDQEIVKFINPQESWRSWDFAFLLDNIVSYDKSDEIKNIIKKNCPKISEKVVDKWTKVIVIHNIFSRNEEELEDEKIVGIDEIFISRFEGLSRDAEMKSSKYEKMSPSEYDPYIGRHYVDEKEYKKYLKLNFSEFKKRNRNLINRFKMKDFVKEKFKDLTNKTFEISYDFDPHATPGINHHTGLPYY